MPPDTSANLAGADVLDIVVLYPRLLGLYGDRGNALALLHRAAGRNLPARMVEVGPEDPIPTQGDLYLLGGTEDSSMLVALDLLRRQADVMAGVVQRAPTLAVCAGFQLLSDQFVGPDDVARPGLGLIDAWCERLPRERAVGEVVLDSDTFGALTGFENHQGNARLGRDAEPLGRVRSGIGNGVDGVEGAVQGNVVATYLHGPVLVRNPDLADHLLASAVGHPLGPLADPPVERLRRERLRARGRFWERRT